HTRAQGFGEIVQDVAPLVELVAVEDGERTGSADGLPQPRCAVDDEEHRVIEIEAALAQVRQQGPADGRVLRVPLAQREDVLLARRIHTQREQDDVLAEWGAVDQDAPREGPPRGGGSQAVRRPARSATKRRETALLDT